MRIQLRQLTGTADRLISVLFSPAGDRLATATNDGGVHIWNAASGAYEREMNVETDHLWAEAFSPAGDVLATANDDDTVRLWCCTTERRLSTSAEHSGRVRSIAFSPDGSMVATGCDDRAVRLWDIAERACLVATLTGHADRVYSVMSSPDGTLLASAGDDGTARLWDTGDGEPSPLRLTLLGLAEGWAALAPDGRYKQDGNVAGQFWHAVGMSRLDPGELDSYLTALRRLPLDWEF